MKKRKGKLSLVIVYSLLAALCYAALGLVIKFSTTQLPNEVIVFFRQIFGILTLLPVIAREQSQGRSIATHRMHLHLLRAVVSIAAMYALFYALKYLPVTDALTLSYTRPLFIPLVVWLWMGKKMSGKVWWGLAVGFLGVITVLRPNCQIFHWSMLVGLLSGAFGAVAVVTVRKLTKTESPTNIIFYYLLVSIPIAFLPMVFSWQMPTPLMWGILLIIGILGTLYQSFLTCAYQNGHTSKVASVLYSAVVFALVFDWIFMGQVIGLMSLLGIALICAGCILVVSDKNAATPVK